MPIFRSIHHKYDFVGRGPVPRPSPHTILLDEVPVPRPSPHLEERTTYPRCCAKTCASHSSHVGF